METEQEQILEFPLHLSLKSIGKDEQDYRQFVIDTVSSFIADLDINLVTTHESHGGKYIAVSSTFYSTKSGSAKCHLWKTKTGFPYGIHALDPTLMKFLDIWPGYNSVASFFFCCIQSLISLIQ